MTEPEKSTLDILLREILELKEKVDRFTNDRELIDRQFRGFGADVENATATDNRLDSGNRGTEALLASHREAGQTVEKRHWLFY